MAKKDILTETFGENHELEAILKEINKEDTYPSCQRHQNHILS